MNRMDNLIISLLSKQFTVLYGNSGTGKTRLATKLINGMDQTSHVKVEVDASGLITVPDEDQIRKLCNTYTQNEFQVEIHGQIHNEKIAIQNCSEVKDLKGNKPAFINQAMEFMIRDASEADKGLNLNYRLIPVNSNWLDPRPLVGYVNIFGEAGETEYTLTPFLEMVLLASHPRRKRIPHFVILDEMNLAPVEYYLSDVLSLMELSEDLDQPFISNINIPYLKKYFESREIDTIDWLLMKEVINIAETSNKGIILPKNLHIIGTINIDDTTHTLSNKVLDRTHMIEVSTEKPSELMSSVQEVVTKDQENKFLELMNSNNFSDLTEIKSKYDEYKTTFSGLPTFEEVLSDLDLVYESLKKIDLDFGYRIIKEYLEYLLIGIEFHGNSFNDKDMKFLFSNAMTQKVLSKLHGNKRELAGVLEELKNMSDKSFYANTKLQEKIHLMQEKLNIKGHVNFLG
jgi:hypothetical protein